MKEMILLFPKYFFSTVTFKGMISKPLFTVSLSAILATFLQLTTFQQSLYLMFGVFVIDFITGIYASYIGFKKQQELIPGTITIKVKIGIFIAVVESEKLRKSAVKAIVYLLLISLSYAVEKIASIKTFTFESFSDKAYTFSTIVALFCVAIEVWSIFLENLPRAGYDIVGSFTKAFTKAKEIKKDIEAD